MLRPREFTTALLLQAAWFEAEAFGGLKPMQMVAQCIGNRVRLGWGDWHQVLSSLGKYSAVDPSVRVLMPQQLPAENDPRFIALLPLMDQVYENSGEKLVGAGVLWADVREISNPWFQSRVLPGKDYKRLAQTAQLVIWG